MNKGQKMFYQYVRESVGTPDRRTSDAGYSAILGGTDDEVKKYVEFFTDLDSYTEYWDIYRPELHGKYMNYVQTVFGGTVQAWFDYAIKEKTPAAAAALAKLKESVAAPQVSEALLALDLLQLSLLKQHLPSANGNEVDFESYLNAIDAFARDALPPDPDRLARTPPDDGRYQYAGRHRMDGAGMWFYWAAVEDCTALLDAGGGMTPHRALLIGAAAFGSAMDFTFRGQAGFRGKTRPEYQPNAATTNLLRAQVRDWVKDGATAKSQAMDLFRIFKS